MPDSVLVFDVDGVLVDVTESYRESIRETVKHFTGQEISPEFIQDLKNAGGWNNDWALSQKIVRDLGVEVDYDTVVAYFQSIFFGNGSDGLIFREKWIARPGLLERLSQRYQLAIFTGRIRSEVRITLGRFASQLNFSPLITTEDIVNGKPAPDGLLKIAELVGGKKLWYIGDTVDDARSANVAGVPFIGIAAPANPRWMELKALFSAEKAVAILDDINQLETVLNA
jgi:HAD superfamily phosphatase